eukprot:scaffold33715_cov219-Isochrysis_galbana.AAC.1
MRSERARCASWGGRRSGTSTASMKTMLMSTTIWELRLMPSSVSRMTQMRRRRRRVAAGGRGKAGP